MICSPFRVGGYGCTCLCLTRAAAMGLVLARIWHRMLGTQDMRIMMVGLDAAGKTTILYKFKLGDVIHTVPTVGFNVESIEYRNIKFTVWDIGGQDRIRPLWRHYFVGTQAIIFVVDSSDRGRIEEAREELMKLLREEVLQDVALLVFANKQDLPKAMSASTIADQLTLNMLPTKRWFVKASCAVTGEGLYDGLDWLATTLKEGKH
eukprot:TRINITY_DN18300_c0_g1_i1.p1 TRINITY_DN18300_c0_g1~~TRINITY_DN18300_c0_g1_i1.p1  ORF type:complete len:206 (+),score=31.88 TRINITY_DN18300_c0_g1_i1:256-873(+)